MYSGDVARFQLKVEGADGIFEILSVVRHVDTADSRGRVGLGVQFCGLDRRVRASLTRALVNTGQDPAAQLGQRQTGLRGGRRFRRAAPVRNDPV